MYLCAAVSYFSQFKLRVTDSGVVAWGVGGAREQLPRKFLAVGKLSENLLVIKFSSKNGKFRAKNPSFQKIGAKLKF